MEKINNKRSKYCSECLKSIPDGQEKKDSTYAQFYWCLSCRDKLKEKDISSYIQLFGNEE